MKMPPCVLHQGDSIPFVMRKFDDHQAWNLPVVHNGKYVGFVSKSRVLSQYRDNLIHQTAKSVA
jgi:CIC family chloride channel protein